MLLAFLLQLRNVGVWTRTLPVLLGFALPLWLSTFDAYSPSSALEQSVGLTAIALGTAGLVDWLDRHGAQRLAMVALAMLVFLALDTVLQVSTGRDVFGFTLVAGRANAAFGEQNLKLGAVCCVLLAIAWPAMLSWQLKTIAIVTSLVCVLLGAARQSWLIWLVLVGMLLWPLRRNLQWRTVLGIVAGLGLLVLGAYFGVDGVQERVATTLLALQGDRAAIDTALSYRLGIWQTALDMSQQHWLNGVGVRQFESSYANFADPADRYAITGAAHAHYWPLERLSETGVLGVFGFLALLGHLGLRMYRAAPVLRAAAWPFFALLVACVLPLNTHYAWHSSFWATLMLLNLALLLRVLEPEP
jgi:O-antigen ligase